MENTPVSLQPVVQRIASFLGAGSFLLLFPSLYGIYFIVLESNVAISAISIITLLLGCLLCAGYIQIARNQTYWLQPRQIWIGTMVYNIFLLMFTSVFFLSGLWCFTVWQAIAVILAIVALYKQDS